MWCLEYSHGGYKSGDGNKGGMANGEENLNFIKYRMFVLEMKPIGVITNRLLFFEVHQMII